MGSPSLDGLTAFGAESRPARVLLVDDDQSMVELTAAHLERELDDVETTMLTNPTETLDEIDAGEYDCVVSDYDMPQCDGLKLLEQLREEGVRLPFVLFTGKGSEEIASQAISAGVDEYLQKGGPEEYPVLANKVSNLVEKHRIESRMERGFLAIESAEEGIGIIDDEGVYRYVNEAYAAVYDRDRRELVGHHWELLYPDEEARRFHEEILPTLESEGTWRGVSTGVTKEGEPVPERLVLTRMDDGGHVCIVQELPSQDGRFDELADTLSHDLQTPLSTARGRVELALETGEDEHLDAALDALDRVDELRADVVDVLRSREIVDGTEPVDIGAVAEEIWQTTVASDDATLALDGDPRFEADADAVRRLLENLLSNAVEHGAEHGSEGRGDAGTRDVTVSVRVGEREDGFYVEDDGSGIPLEEREDVVDPGFSTKPEGTGIGLASVREIVDAHGWRMTVGESAAGGARVDIVTEES